MLEFSPNVNLCLQRSWYDKRTDSKTFECGSKCCFDFKRNWWHGTEGKLLTLVFTFYVFPSPSHALLRWIWVPISNSYKSSFEKARNALSNTGLCFIHSRFLLGFSGTYLITVPLLCQYRCNQLRWMHLRVCSLNCWGVLKV